jgi:hypothetical protein
MTLPIAYTYERGNILLPSEPPQEEQPSLPHPHGLSKAFWVDVGAILRPSVLGLIFTDKRAGEASSEDCLIEVWSTIFVFYSKSKFIILSLYLKIKKWG